MANEAQAQLWTDVLGPLWLASEERVTAIASPHGREAMRVAALTDGERVLDVGCGMAGTTIEIATLVGPDGHATGLDISSTLLERGKARVAASGLKNIDLVVGDAQTYDGREHDVVFSEFGTMFFDDQVAAHENLRHALRSGGRLSCSVWQDRSVNPWMVVPAMAAASVFGFPPPPPPDAPGPFALADPGRLRSILEDAGFSQIEIAPHEATIEIKFNPDDFGQILGFGPMRQAFESADGADRLRAIEAVTDAMRSFETDGKHYMPSASWIVTSSG